MNDFNEPPSAVSVETRARLHLGFLDMSGALGRRFGSLGLSIDAFSTRFTVTHSPRCRAEGPGAERALACARRVLAKLGVDSGVRLAMNQAIPDHQGLGSGTQMALAVGRAVARLHGHELSTREAAALLDRGRRSGIGIGAFDHGGFLLDGGVGADGQVPPVIARTRFPPDWRVLLILDNRGKGLHGGRETAAFRRLPPFPPASAARLCHLTLMQILPAVAEARLPAVAEGIAELQRVMGDHFAPAQGGRFTSPAVADALGWAQARGFPGVGQSSWGPTGFVLLPDQGAAERLLAEARRRFGELSALRFVIAGACNQGTRLQVAQGFQALQEAR